MKSTFSFSLKRLVLLSMIITSAVVFTSCKDDEAPVNTAKNIVQVASADTSFSILVAAVVKTDLVNALSAPSANLTVFAPVNSAFRAIGYPSAAYINNNVTSPADIAALKNVLLYHVLGSKVPSSAITGTNTGVATLKGDSIYATKNTGGVFINGVKVVQADVAASNGVIHVIGSVLMPPSGNLLTTAVALGANTTPSGFSLLVAAVLRADASAAGNPISSALSSAGPFTVFAPTNQAFIDAGFPTTAAINAAPAADLAKILLYHVVSARVFSSDLVNNSTPLTALGGTNTVTITLPPAKVKGKANASASNIVAADVVATNGVIHVIDRVLLPL